jgi:hypothetical protein
LFKDAPADAGLERVIQDLLEDILRLHLPDSAAFNPVSVADGLQDLRAEMSRLAADSLFRQQLAIVSAKTERSDKTAHAPATTSRRRMDEARKLQLEGFKLGLENVVFVDPFFQHLDERYGQRILYEDSESAEATLIRALQRQAGNTGLTYHMISLRDRPDTQTFRQLILLRDWLLEKETDRSMVSMLYNEIEVLRSKLGTKNFLWVAAVGRRQDRSSRGIIAMAGILLPPFLPYAVYYLSSAKRETELLFVLYDLQEGRNVLVFPRELRLRAGKDVINAVVYDVLMQISTD